jgi:predicted permease
VDDDRRKAAGVSETNPPRLAALLLRLRSLGHRREQVEADLLELFQRRLEERGARYARHRYYADVLSLCRPSPRLAEHRIGWSDASRVLREAGRDLAYAARLFRRSPAVVATAIAGLGLAIGVSTSVFSILDGVMFRPSGIADPAGAVRVLKGGPDNYSTSWPYAELTRMKEAAQGITLEAWLPKTESFLLDDGDEGSAAPVMFVTGGLLEALTPRAALGRLLAPSDDRVGAPPALVMSHGFWVRRFGADRSIVGRRLRWNGAQFTVVGVTERAFRGQTDAPPAFWAPISAYHVALGGPPVDGSIEVAVLGRTHPGVTRPAIEASLGGIAAGFPPVDRSRGRPGGVTLTDATGPIRASQVRLVALIVSIITTAIALVLLLACVNVTNLLLASAIARRHEIGLRAALGASRLRVARQLLTESLALGFVAGALGLLFAVWFTPIVVSFTGVPGLPDGPELRVGVFAFGVSLIAGVGAGLAPARGALRGDLAGPLREARPAGGTASSRLRSTLIGAQAAASIVLVVVAALLTRGMIRATKVDVGFDADRLLTVAATLPRGTYDERGAQSYWNAALERARSQPGVRAASLTSSPPFGNAGSRVTIFKRGRSRYTVYHHETRSDYFATLGLRTIRGRAYTHDEVDGRAAVAVISDSVARDFFPGEDPIGQPLDRVVEGSRRTIVGVVSDAITARLRELGAAVVYTPIEDTRTARIVVRTDLKPGELVPSLRTSLASIDGRVRLEVVTVSDGLKRQRDQPRILATLAGTLAALALMLAVIGIYGVTSFAVGQRTREIGVRMALGAHARDVVRLLLGESLRPVSVGLAVGVAAALVCMRVFDGVLYGVSSSDPAAFGAALLILLTAAAAAVVLPSRRATRIDPAAVLRL